MATILDRLVTQSDLSEELAALAQQVQRSVVVVRGTRSGGGSGVIWNDRGLVITNHHVVPGESAEIEVLDGTRLPARTIARSERDDLAALQIDGAMPNADVFPAAIGDSSRLRPGALVIAVGNPLGERNAVTLGMVSGISQSGSADGPRQAIRVAITLRPGNSGGALADVRGRVVGIPNMVVGNGAALAVPSIAVEELLSGVKSGRPFFGLALRPVELPAPVVARHALGAPTGMLVIGVAPDSPADQAGLGLGDVVVTASASGATIDVFAQLRGAVVGKPTRLAVIRAGDLHWFEVAPRAA